MLHTQVTKGAILRNFLSIRREIDQVIQAAESGETWCDVHTKLAASVRHLRLNTHLIVRFHLRNCIWKQCVHGIKKTTKNKLREIISVANTYLLRR